MFPWDAEGLVEWMYSMPLAAARAMADRVSQLSGGRPEPLLPERLKKGKAREDEQ